jgi:coproporphyrinogen III oxidase
MSSQTEIAHSFQRLQQHICSGLEQMDGKAKFIADEWERKEGGGGITCTIKNGGVIQKGGVAFSEVFGPVSDIMRKQLGLDGDSFFATGVSIVLHPLNPHVPIIHMNVRYFQMDTGEYWFGGGIDLTPHFIDPSAAQLFHRRLKTICDSYDLGFYPRFKDWADDYFFLPHREETRGIGGIFFDHMQHSETISKEQLYQFCYNLAFEFPSIYSEQVALFKEKPYNEQDLRWQSLRRGRYVEFNLVHDRGTKFGLLSGGRTESILMSLPETARWEYLAEVGRGSAEQQTLDLLKKGIDWIGLSPNA